VTLIVTERITQDPKVAALVIESLIERIEVLEEGCRTWEQIARQLKAHIAALPAKGRRGQ
jgi:hypothetical protein